MFRISTFLYLILRAYCVYIYIYIYIYILIFLQNHVSTYVSSTYVISEHYTSYNKFQILIFYTNPYYDIQNVTLTKNYININSYIRALKGSSILNYAKIV